MSACLRVACLKVPLFPLAARLRGEPELKRESLAVLAGNGNAARVVAATRLARRAGVRPGMTLPQARALSPKLVTRARDEECERAAQEVLLEIAERFGPRVEDGGGGLAYLDATGLELHHPGEFPERDLGRALMAAAEAAGLPARVGVAASKLAARLAAGRSPSPTVVPAGEEAGFLDPLPLDRLTPQVEVSATLERWGLRSIGELARLGEAEVVSRLGDAGRRLHALARGLDPQPLIPRQPPPHFREGLTLEWPIVALEPFLFVARAALERLLARLEERGLACERLELALRLEPEGWAERSLDLPAPTTDVKTLLTLVRLDLEARPPGAPIAGFTFTAKPDRPRQVQLSLFGPAALSPDRLATTLARLFALLGVDRAGSPRPLDAHRPGGFTLVPYAPPPPPRESPEPRDGRGLLAVRALRPALPMEVITTEPAPAEANGAGGGPSPVGQLLSMQPVAGEAAEGRPRPAGKVRVASGPWTLEEEWWTEHPVERDYWDVELSDGGLYRVYRDRRTGDWFADGIYD